MYLTVHRIKAKLFFLFSSLSHHFLVKAAVTRFAIMSTIALQTLHDIQKYIVKWQGELPPKYLRIISIGMINVSFWTIRNVFWKILNRIRSYPYGPLGMPFFGCFFQFAITPMSFVVNLGRKYDPMAYVPLMMSNNLFINDPVIVKQLFQTMKINTRPLVTIRRPLPFLWPDGHEWSSRRKFFSQTAMTLSNSSFVLSNTSRSMGCVIPRIDRLVAQKALWCPHHDVEYFAINNAWTAVFGHVLSIDDPFVPKFCDMMVRATDMIQLGILLDLISNYSGFDLISRHSTQKIHFESDDMLKEWMKSEEHALMLPPLSASFFAERAL